MTFQPADWISLTNLLVAAVAAVIALLSPRIAWKLTQRSHAEDQKRATRMAIFGQLMQNRHMLQSREVVQALNLIEVAFHDMPEVRRLWREYHSMINNPAFFKSDVGDELRKQKLTELQAEMARVLGYSIDNFDVERIYTPTWLHDEQRVNIFEREHRLAIISQQRPGQPSSSGPDGVYVIRFKDNHESGTGILGFRDGRIEGSTLTGSKLNGTYVIQDGRVRGGVAVHDPAPKAEIVDVVLNLQLPLEAQSHRVMIGERSVDVTFQRI